MLRMARPIGRRGPWVAMLVRVAIGLSVSDAAAAYLPQQNAKTLKVLAACLEAVPRSSPLTGATQGEKEWILQYVRPQYQNKSVKEAIELLRKDFASGEETLRQDVASAEEAKAILK